MRAIEDLRRRKEAILGYPGFKKKKEIFYDRGMLPPRERVEKLLDPNSFFELDMFATHHCSDFGMDKREIPCEGVITGFGEIGQRKVAVYAQDFSALGGSYGEMHGRKICALMDAAADIGVPIIGICQSGGLRLHETLGPMEMFGQLFRRNTHYSGLVPQISVIFGIVAGGQAYSPGLTDFILMGKKASVYIAGPTFVKAQTGRQISDEELGGAVMHSKVSGLVDIVAETEEELLQQTRKLVAYLPASCHEPPPSFARSPEDDRCSEKLEDIVPEDFRKPFNMLGVIRCVLDSGDFLELKANFARNMITGFGCLGGEVVGIVANQPNYLGGVIDIKGAEKGARFVRFCDAFNIPLVTVQDSPGYLIGKEMEQQGIIYKGAKLLYAYAEATVPKITLILRKAYAGAYIALGSQYIGADFVFAWPIAEISSVGPNTAASIIFRKEIHNEMEPKKIENLYKKYYDEYANAFRAASLRHINDIIEPQNTRSILVKSVRILKGKKQASPRKKHGNIPL